MTNIVVIGAGFGDEGKGLITDFETRRISASTVVRFNGGAQAGHTVVTDDGRRHVFGHIGAGAFAGARTYLAQKFIFNPLLLERERARVRTGDMSTNVSVHPRARVSTIYDMVLNSIAEEARDLSGHGRHGSCGMGINETVTRHEAGFELFAGDLIHGEIVRNTFVMIKRDWVPHRLAQLLPADHPCRYEILAKYRDVLGLEIQKHVDQLRDCCSEVNIHTHRATNRSIVFEGAQGLRLDEFLGDFPHVTRSITGLPYAILSAASMGIKELQPTYVTRCYTTRHGAGPLPYEGEEFSDGSPIVDSTNITNEWQGSFRFAPLDLVQLKKFIDADVQRGTVVGHTHDVKILPPRLAITCLDQIGRSVRIKTKGGFRIVNLQHIPKMIENQVGVPVSHVSYGPTAKDVQFLL